MRVCDVLLSLVTTLIDLGLLANCRRQTDTSILIQKPGVSTPPTSSNTNIFSSPTKEAVDTVSTKRREKLGSQEAKKIEKDVCLENNIPEKTQNIRDDKDAESGLSGVKENVGPAANQGGMKDKTGEKSQEEEDQLSHHNTFMDIVIR